MRRAPAFRFRLIPATMVMCMLLLGIKVGDVIRGTNELTQLLLVGEVEAQQPEKKDNAEAEAPAEEAAKEEDAKEAESATEGGASSDAEEKTDSASEEDSEATKEEEDAEAEKKASDEGAESDSKEAKKESDAKKDAAVKDATKTEGAQSLAGAPKKEFTQVELDLLQSLSQRREELDQWARDVQMKETLLDATEKRLDAKIEEIQKLREDVGQLIAQYNEQENAKIRSLVKIYENMKPKDAASIFEEMDMPILLLVVDKMSERKVAPILANMSPKKATEVTQQLAEQRRLDQTVVQPAQLEGAENQPPALN